VPESPGSTSRSPRETAPRQAIQTRPDLPPGNAGDQEHEPVRKRLGDFKNPSTAALFSTLSLYLAGKLGLSLTITQPMLAVMLYAVHGASGNWNVLLD
jgi:hypothetical protein